MTRACRAFSFSSVFSASSNATRSTPCVRSGRDVRRFRQRDVQLTAAALRAIARAREVDEDPPHDLRRDAEEVRAVLPADVFPVDQPQVGLVDERGGLQDVARPLAGHASRREAAQLPWCTNGVNASSAARSPLLHDTSSWVTFAGAVIDGFLA